MSKFGLIYIKNNEGMAGMLHVYVEIGLLHCPVDGPALVREMNSTSWDISSISTVFRFGYKPLVIAIDSKFPRKRKLIARVLYKSVEGVKKLVHRARTDKINQTNVLHIKAHLPENIDTSLILLKRCLRISR